MLVLLWVVAWILAGCGSEKLRASITAGATVAVSPPGVSCANPAEDQIRFRLQYGLRADACWIQAVAADPASKQGEDEFGIPLLPFERLDLETRHTDSNLLRDIDAYGALFPDSYAGVYMDSRASNAFIASFKNDAAKHAVALSHLLPGAKVEVRDVDWSTKELNDLVKVVEAEQDWFQLIGVRYLTAERSITDNFVSIDYLGPVDAAARIRAHFGDPTWLVVDRQGPLPWSGPRGDLVIEVVDQAGRPVPGLWCQFAAEDPEAATGGEDIFGTDERGRCTLENLPAVAYRITLQRFVDNDHYEPLKEFRVVLLPGGTARRVTVDL